MFVTTKALLKTLTFVASLEWNQAVAAAAVMAPAAPVVYADHEGLTTRFGDEGDTLIGGTLKCAPDVYVEAHHFVCAHRKYRCGTVLLLENTKNGKRSFCTVADRGPYGAIAENGDERVWYIKRRTGEPPPAEVCEGCAAGEWRSALDISPAAADFMDHDGLERVRIWRVDWRFLKRALILAERRQRI